MWLFFFFLSFSNPSFAEKPLTALPVHEESSRGSGKPQRIFPQVSESSKKIQWVSPPPQVRETKKPSKLFKKGSNDNTPKESFSGSKKFKIKPFPVIHRPEVTRWIRFFSQSSSPYFKLWLKRAYRYFPNMERIFQARGLPKELVSMSLIESSLSSKAVSPAKAVGYWQFIEPTGLRFGLRINNWIDERQDFQKSAKAASQYLYQLYEEFEDWLLAMAAYNMGEGRLRGLIQKHKTKSFWLLSQKADFPTETALYVPKVLAAAYIVRDPVLYGLSEFIALPPYNYDIFFTPGGTNLKELSQGAKISLKELKALNPDLKSETIPESISFHQVRIPKGAGILISNWLDKQLSDD